MKPTGPQFITFAKRIRAVRKALNKTQKTMGEELGVSESAVQGYELGKNLPTGKVIGQLHNLGVNTEWLWSAKGPVFWKADLRELVQAFEPAGASDGDPDGAYFMDDELTRLVSLLEFAYTNGSADRRLQVRGMLTSIIDKIQDDNKKEDQ